MRIFFSGASSFTGYWFVKELIQRGHTLHLVFRKKLQAYSGLRKKRVEMLIPHAKCSFEAPLGSENFFAAFQQEKSWEHFCHHASAVEGYRSPLFDAEEAQRQNCAGIEEALSKTPVKALTYTGSIFEANVGEGEAPLRSFSPYADSKSASAKQLQKICGKKGVFFKRFVIANPFGPLEEPNLTRYLLNCWKKKETPALLTPHYIRDQLPVTLLASRYADFIEGRETLCTPSCYPLSILDFAKLFAKRAEKTLGIPCPVAASSQEEFLEPRKRIGTDPLPSTNLESFWTQYLSAS